MIPAVEFYFKELTAAAFNSPEPESSGI